MIKLKPLMELKNQLNEQPTAVTTEVNDVVVSLNNVITKSKIMVNQVFNEIQIISGDENNAGKLILHSNINVVLDQLSSYITSINTAMASYPGHSFEEYTTENSKDILGDELVNKLNN